MARLGERIKSAWNAFVNQDEDDRLYSYGDYATSYGIRPDRTRLPYSSADRTIIASIKTRISIDGAAIELRHVRNDENKRYVEDIPSGLNNCLTVQANIDQAATQFRQDLVHTMLEHGVAAVVPVDTSAVPDKTGSYDILTMRVGTVVGWFPSHVRLNLYNDRKGTHEEITLPKSVVALVENPLYMIMNEPNSTLQRLIRKLNMLDGVDEQTSSGKLDLIIQLPYVIKSEARRQQAEQRRKDIEFQLKGSQYGIAYTDGTERITQLNRPVENNLLTQIKYLTEMLHTQLGITPEVMNGTADEQTMLNYTNRTIEPIIKSIVESMRAKFLTKTARTQLQSVDYFKSPFSLVPVQSIADIADKFTRNEIMTSNELRSIIGMAPSKDPKADELRNSNMPAPNPEPTAEAEMGDNQNGT